MTHINAYVEELVQKRDAVVKALSDYEVAKNDLKNHPDYEAGMLARLPFEVLYPEAPKPAPASTKPTAREAKV